MTNRVRALSLFIVVALAAAGQDLSSRMEESLQAHGKLRGFMGTLLVSLPHAAGSLYSTVGDLYRWDRALYTDKVISRKSYEAMTTPVKNDYGYGVILKPVFNHKHVGHGGGINGFSTSIDRFADGDAVVIVLSNVVSSNACAIGSGLSAILFNRKYDIPREHKQVAMDPKLLDRHAGKYGEMATSIVFPRVNLL